MKIVAIMPIKLNNERCPGKNIRLLGNKPLLRHALDNLLEIGLCDEIIVYCSDDSISEFLPGGVDLLKRPDYLDLPTSNFNQIFDCFIETIDADVYVYAHATAPFIKQATMKECIEAVISGKYDSAFCAERIQSFLWEDGKPLNFDEGNLPRTQDLKPIFSETSGIYVFTREVYKKYRRRIGLNPYIKELSFKEAIDIDMPSDFEIAEILVGITEL